MPIRAIHAAASQRLSCALIGQGKLEEARGLAHDAVERFRPILPEGNAMVRLMEIESSALGSLGRQEEALVLMQHCLKTRTDHPDRFPDGGKVPFTCAYTLAQTLLRVGRLDEAETMLKKALAMLESGGIKLQPNVVHAMDCLGDVFWLQGRKKEAEEMKQAMKKLVPQVFPKDHPDYKMFMES
jgi:tetratricopeptide (TPR) repeat protein